MPAALQRSLPRLRAGVSDETAHPKFNAGALYEQHFGFVWRNLLRLGVPEQHLEDAAQEVFLVVHRRGESYDEQRSSVQTWLIGIVLRVSQNRRRSLRRGWSKLTSLRSEDDLHAIPSDAAGPAELVAKREAAALLRRALDCMDDKKRAIFVLVDIEQLSVPEAAGALNLNLNTAYARLRSARIEFQRALRRLRTMQRPPHDKRSP